MTVVELRAVTPAVDRELAGALLEVQHAAYAVEAGLIGDERIPPLHENLEDLQNAPLQWLAAFADGGLVGAVAWSEDSSEVDIDRLLVAPSAHRRGGGIRARPGCSPPSGQSPYHGLHGTGQHAGPKPL